MSVKFNHGFSLVELSIVLVILGLLAGGIITGQSLIRAAGIRSVTNDLQRYSTAIYTFRDKYSALPGDMTNATKFWTARGGDGTGNDAGCINASSSSTKATCNGNGDGIVEGAAVLFCERFLAWQHLANAGLIAGSFTGVDGAATHGDGADANFVKHGVNVPQGRATSSAYFEIGIRPATSGDTNWFDQPNQSTHMGAQGNKLTSEEAWSIDKKLDDGNPVTGRIYSVKKGSTWASNCTTTNDSTAQYNILSGVGVTNCPLYYGF